MQANRQMAQAEQEIELLYRKYAPGLLTYVRMRVPSPEDAEDLVVEVFVAALEQAKFAALSEKEKQRCQGYGQLAWITPTAHEALAATWSLGGSCLSGSPRWQYGHGFLRGSTYEWRHCLSSSNSNTFNCSCATLGDFGQYVGNTWIDCGLILRYELDRDLYGSLPRQAQ